MMGLQSSSECRESKEKRIRPIIIAKIELKIVPIKSAQKTQKQWEGDRNNDTDLLEAITEITEEQESVDRRLERVIEISDSNDTIEVILRKAMGALKNQRTKDRSILP